MRLLPSPPNSPAPKSSTVFFEGFPKRLIEEASARRQAKLDKGDDSIIGVNCYKTDEKTSYDILELDNSARLNKPGTINDNWSNFNVSNIIT